MKRRKTSSSSLSIDLLLETLELAKEGFLFFSISQDGSPHTIKVSHFNRAALQFLFCDEPEFFELENFRVPNTLIPECVEKISTIGRGSKKDSKDCLSDHFWQHVCRCLQGNNERDIQFTSKGMENEAFGNYFISISFSKLTIDDEVFVVAVMEGSWHEYPMIEERRLEIDEEQFLLQLMKFLNPNVLMTMYDPSAKDLLLVRSTPEYDSVFFNGHSLKRHKWSTRDLKLNANEIEWWGRQYCNTIGSNEPYDLENTVSQIGDRSNRTVAGRCLYVDSYHPITREFKRNNKDEVDGYYHRFIIVFEDVTEERELSIKAEEMKEVNEMQDQFINSCYNVMELLELLEDGHLKYHLVNKAGQELLSMVGAYNVRGKTSKELGISLEHVKLYSRYVAETKRTGENIYQTMYDPLLEKWYSISCWKSSQDKYGFILTDISDVKRLEGELLKSKQELESQVQCRTRDLNLALAARSRFLATMSHEVRTPLSGIMGCLDHFQELSGINFETKEVVKIGKICSEQLLVVINDVLDFSKIDAHQLNLDVQPSHVQSIVEESIEVVSIQATKQQLPISTRTEIPLGLHILVDKGRLRQVLINLLSNASKFTEEGEIELTLKSEFVSKNSCKLHFAVRDTGIGIREDFRDKIFLPFLQSDSSITRKHGGSGLGLCISKRIVEMMGGTLDFESTLGKGSRFFFSIEAPTVEVENTQLQKLIDISDRLFENSKHRKSSIAIIDSNRTVLNNLTIFCNHNGIQTFCSQSISEALSLGESRLLQNCLFIAESTEKEEDLQRLKDFCKKHDKKLALVGKDNQVEGYQTLRKPFRKKDFLLLLSEVILDSKVVLEKEEPKKEVNLNGLRILVAEDNVFNQKVIYRMLKSLGTEPIIVENGKLAVEQALKQNFDLILMDCMMPVMGGIEATLEIRRIVPKSRQPKIVALTADAMGDHKKACLENGMDDVLTKPINQQQLRDALIKVPRRGDAE